MGGVYNMAHLLGKMENSDRRNAETVRAIRVAHSIETKDGKYPLRLLDVGKLNVGLERGLFKRRS